MFRNLTGGKSQRGDGLCHRKPWRLPSAFCLLYAILFFPATQAFAQRNSWTRQPAGTLAWLHSVFFLDQNRGWAVGSRGALLATENGGRSWVARPRPSEDVLRDIHFSDERNGWVVCERNFYDLKTDDEQPTYLMSTSDGGSHWKRVKMSDADVNLRLVGAVFSPSGRGWAFGEGGVIYTTEGAGANWVRLQAPTRHLLLGGTFIDDQRGWLVGAGATILQTSDGGETWNLTHLAGARGVRFNDASFVDNRLGWAVGSGGNIYRTVNGGRTWQAQRSGVEADLYDVKFLDAVEGWAVGAEGTVLYTNDAGLHWTVEPSGTTHPLERVFFADRTHGWTVGFGGTILAYERTEAPRLRR